MNVKQLIEIASTLPPDAPVLVPASDHSYRAVTAEAATANRWEKRQMNYSEDFGDEHRQPDETSVPALVLR